MLAFRDYYSEPVETDADRIAADASEEAATWHLAPKAVELLRCYEALVDLDVSHTAIDEALHEVFADLDALRDEAINADLDSVDFGDNYAASDSHYDHVTASALTVEAALKAMRRADDDAAPHIGRAA